MTGESITSFIFLVNSGKIDVNDSNWSIERNDKVEACEFTHLCPRRDHSIGE